ncbi:unannotated protein [freshwater metagenome]|uniref:Unannotated protein n=1 Tax=freshwater metagenome TaxID=449393 RepID=A0A6J7JMV5_9ZZZZ
MRSSNRRASKVAWRAPSARGVKPSKVKRSVAKPDNAIAITGALGPGITLTSKSSAIASRAKRNPGSLIVGIPASETTKTLFPLRRYCKISSLRSVSFPSKKEITFPVNVTPISTHKR